MERSKNRFEFIDKKQHVCPLRLPGDGAFHQTQKVNRYKLTESGRNSLLIVEVLYKEQLFGAIETLG
jgi:hypothetical protein